MQPANMILKSSNIFTAATDAPINGFVAIAGDRILAVEPSQDFGRYTNEHTKIIDLKDKTVCPGFVDVHCFFTGYVLGFVGADLSAAKSPEEIITAVRDFSAAKGIDQEGVLLGHGWNCEVIKDPNPLLLDKTFGERPVILFAEGGESCWMNAAAGKKYQFTPETCYPEAYWRLLCEVLTDKDFIVDQFKRYMTMLNSRGITAVKEMGFDDFYGFTDVLEELEKKQELTLRVSFMSQPVGFGMNLEYGKAMRERYESKFLEFSGYNRMTDGSISVMCGDLKQPYSCSSEIHCAQKIDYDLIEDEVLRADAEGFRFSLHAQGDAAISKTIDIFHKCRKENGKLVNRHAMTDIEFSDPADIERMAEIGVIAEIYPQIMSIYDREEKLSLIEERIGKERGKNYWNRRKMADCGVRISCGTDLPLLIPDIPESVYHSCGGLFPGGGEPFNKENTLTVAEVLAGWTSGGQYNLGHESILGTLEAGKLADIAVLDGDIFNTSLDQVRNIKICLTLVNGKPVYNTIY